MVCVSTCGAAVITGSFSSRLGCGVSCLADIHTQLCVCVCLLLALCSDGAVAFAGMPLFVGVFLMVLLRLPGVGVCVRAVIVERIHSLPLEVLCAMSG